MGKASFSSDRPPNVSLPIQGIATLVSFLLAWLNRQKGNPDMCVRRTGGLLFFNLWELLSVFVVLTADNTVASTPLAGGSR